MGNKIQVTADWLNSRVSFMEGLLELKVKQVPEYKDWLTSNLLVVPVEDTTSDFWARGQDSRGKNTLGCLHVLTRVKVLLGRA